jgi:hypothetical protein
MLFIMLLSERAMFNKLHAKSHLYLINKEQYSFNKHKSISIEPGNSDRESYVLMKAG